MADLSFLGAAGLFAALHAPFLAMLQVLVYAGAIMVLFLFVIMMLEGPVMPTELARPRCGPLWSRWCRLIAILVALVLWLPVDHLPGFTSEAPEGFGQPVPVAELLLGDYVLRLRAHLHRDAGRHHRRPGPRPQQEEEQAMDVGLNHYLVLAAAVFLVGMVGFVMRRNTLVMLMCVELMLSSANLVFAAFSRELGNAAGHVFVLMNFAVAAAEVAIGLAILVQIFRLRRTVDADELTTLME